jgi:hypothetical protein
MTWFNAKINAEINDMRYGSMCIIIFHMVNVVDGAKLQNVSLRK